MSQSDLLMEYFKKHQKKDIPHPEIVDWATAEWKKRHNEVFRDPDRAIRKLHQNGLLIKVKKGVYRYDSDLANRRDDLEDFDQKTKEAIFKRDNYTCILCGKGKREGAELHADHIKPKDWGGKATIENGQTLCSACNILKKRYGVNQTLEKYSKKMLKIAKENNDKPMINLFNDIMKVLEKHKNLREDLTKDESQTRL